jgi:hypothetical protein
MINKSSKSILNLHHLIQYFLQFVCGQMNSKTVDYTETNCLRDY